MKLLQCSEKSTSAIWLKFDMNLHVIVILCILAVQEERQRVKERGEGEVESTNCANTDMPVEKILEAEIIVEPKYESYVDTQVGDQVKYYVNM